MGTQADLSHLLCASAAAALQPDPPHRNACRYCGQDLRHPETIAVEKSEERLPGLRSPWAFQVSRCYWNLQPHPSWSSPCCSICPTALYATQIGILQHTLDIRCLTRHLIPLYVWRPSTMYALSRPLLRLPLPTRESVLLAATPLPKVWEAKTWDACLCQVFPRWRDLALPKPFQSMFARDVSIIFSFWHGPGSQLRSTVFSQLRMFLVGKGHYLLFPKEYQPSQWWGTVSTVPAMLVWL